MSTETPPTTSTQAAPEPAPERIFVPIPKAGPGQGYRAPKNEAQPLLQGLSRIITVLLCISLPIAPAIIFGLILGGSQAISEGLLWLWIVMILLIESIAIFVAIGVARESLGLAGVGPFWRRGRG